MAIHQSVARQHNEWLALVEPVGPFPAVPVLGPAFGQGLPTIDKSTRRDVLRAYDEWADAQQGARGVDRAMHTAWIEYVLGDVLGYIDDIRLDGQKLPPAVVHKDASGAVRRPAYAIADKGVTHLLVAVEPPGTRLDARRGGDSPESAFADLLRDSRVQLGLLTNGEDWVAVFDSPDAPTGYARFPAGLWSEEPLILRAFVALFHVDRLIDGQPAKTLDLYRESLTHQHEVTEQLGKQVRKAIEVLLQALDRCDRDAGRTLLDGYTEAELYEAALTVMMRLVFLFFAEEQETPLLPMDSDVWQRHYAASTLREQLRIAADQHGEEVLERRADAWSRLLATFRAVYGGVNHDDLRMVPHLGRLFDPDAFPFLEGRPRDSDWRQTPAEPLRIDNRATLHLLEALQLLQVSVAGGGIEARKLSFRGLGVEEIGTVYEGLLDHTAKRARVPTLGLIGTKKCPDPTVKLTELEKRTGDERLDWLEETTGRSRSALANALAAPLVPGADGEGRWRRVCDNDAALLDRVRPFAALVRDDTLDDPVLYPAGTLHVTAGTDRRQTGTHYTPQTLAKEVVHYALEPVVFVGPAEGKPREKWALRPPAELLGLRICDPAMGSGAFLVQTAQQLADHLLDAWKAVEDALPTGARAVVPYGEAATGAPDEEPLATEPRERRMQALRLVCDRCLYGVDKNPLAVEMAKLSLWLLTLQKGRPFTFLDHALRPGDSLLGLTEPWQIERLSLEKLAESPLPMLPRGWNERLAEALAAREAILGMASRDADAIRQKADRLGDAEGAIEALRIAGDLVVGAALVAAVEPRKPEEVLAGASRALEALFGGEGPPDEVALALAQGEARRLLQKHARPEHGIRRPFHWVLEFPEVFAGGERRGFDVIVGNPPFVGGQNISAAIGQDAREYLVRSVARGVRGSADLCAYFLLRMGGLGRTIGTIGALTVNTIGQGDTREVGLAQVVDEWRIRRAVPSRPWPGHASVEVSQVWLGQGMSEGRVFIGSGREIAWEEASHISPSLKSELLEGRTPERLISNRGKSFQGSNVLGSGFVLDEAEAEQLLLESPRNRDCLRLYLNGRDLNRYPDQRPKRWVVNFGTRDLDDCRDWPDLFAIVESRVKPQRMAIKGDGASARQRRRLWWQFTRPARALYDTVEGNNAVLVVAQTSNTWAPCFVPNGWVYSHSTIAFEFDSFGAFALLQSSLHEVWKLRFGPTLRTDARYTPTDCFETFPFPESLDGLDDIGAAYHSYRADVMQATQLGLTKTYNRFHDPDCADADIEKLRELHRDLDNAVAEAYGWADLALDHGFHDTRLGVRYTVSDQARRTLLARLLKLNHARYADEVKRGLHDKKRKKKGAKRRRSPKKSNAGAGDAFAPTQGDLFGGPQLSLADAPAAPAELTPDAILAALRASDTPLGKSAVTESLGTDAGWSAAIKALLADGRVVREGKGRGTVYRPQVTASSDGG